MKTSTFLLTILFSFLLTSVSAQTVYITKTGKKYHKEGCRYLSKSSYSISLSDAIAKGYTPCSVCKPSSKVTSTSPTKQNNSSDKANPETTKTTKDSNGKSVQCSAITKKGTRCTRMTKSPNGKCWQHGGD